MNFTVTAVATSIAALILGLFWLFAGSLEKWPRLFEQLTPEF